MTKVQLTEIFHSIQGEGVQQGLPTVFVRLTGCSLRCSWCDTTYSFHGGSARDVDDVLAEVAKFPTKRVCLTGGEPMDQPEAALEIMARLLRAGYEVVLETSGAIDLAEADRLEPRNRLTLSVDVKCPASNMHLRNHWPNLALLKPSDQLKFVLSDERDYRYALDVIRKNPGLASTSLVFQPRFECQGVVPVRLEGEPATARWLAERMLADGVAARLSLQLHKVIWDPGERAR